MSKKAQWHNSKPLISIIFLIVQTFRTAFLGMTNSKAMATIINNNYFHDTSFSSKA